MSPQTKKEEFDLLNQQEDKNMSPHSESLDDGRSKKRWKLTKKQWLILVFSILFILVVVGVTCLVVYYPREPAENSVQQLYENQKERLYNVGCSPKPEVKYILSLLSEKDDIGDNEIEERYIFIYQCNDNSSFCGVNGNCTCKPTENGQTKATAIIKFRDPHVNNSEWQYEHRTLNIMNHTECVGRAENSVPQLPQGLQLYVKTKKLLEDLGCFPKPELKNILSLLPENDDIGLGDNEIEERFIVVFQCNDNSSFCGVNGNCACEPTENGQINTTAIIKFRNHHIQNSEWQYEHRTLNIMNHTECVDKTENALPQLYEKQKNFLQDIDCSPKPKVMNMLNLLPEKDDIKLGDYEIEERFIVVFQCNDYSSFCGVDEICTCEPTENGQINATGILKIRNRHIKNAEWQYEYRTLNIMNHTECVGLGRAV